jgi:hypothetical protein
MSAAATAAGYLYASGRLRGRGQRDQEEAHKPAAANEPRAARPRSERAERVERAKPPEARKEIRVAALPTREEKPRRTPTIQYRVRRWKPDE